MLVSKKVKSIALMGLILFLNFNAFGNCTPKARDCSFYRKCLQPKFNCDASEYPIGYGEKYCNKFNGLGMLDLSDYGILWRDETLTCLQSALVPSIAMNSTINTCNQLTELAFDSHPSCYTNNYMSICELPISDWTTIGTVVDAADLASLRSLKQIASVIKTCSSDYIFDLKLIEDQLNHLKQT